MAINQLESAPGPPGPAAPAAKATMTPPARKPPTSIIEANSSIKIIFCYIFCTQRISRQKNGFCYIAYCRIYMI